MRRQTNPSDMPEIRDLEAASTAWANEPEAPVEIESAASAPETPTIDPLPSSDGAAAAAVDAGAAAEQQARNDLIAAMLGDETMPLDPSVRIPLDVAGRIEYMTLAELRSGGMRQADYTRKTMEAAEERRQVQERERELRIAAATIEQQQKSIEHERQRLLKANEDPDEYARYIRHVELLQSDPEYRENWERGQNAKVREAMDAASEAISTEEYQRSVIEDIENTAKEFAANAAFSGVRPEDALALYSARLQAGQAELKTGDLQKAFADLASERQSLVTPLQTQIETLTKTVNELTAQRAADAANAPRRAAIVGSRAPAVTRPSAQPNAGAPVAPGAPTRRRMVSLEEAGTQWARG
jgi:hypothetical protein